MPRPSSLVVVCMTFLWTAAGSATAAQLASQPEVLKLMQQAQQALDRGNLQEAAPLLEELLRLDPANKPARQALVNAYVLSGDEKKAEVHLHFLRQRFPGDPAVQQLALRYAFHQADFEQARELAQHWVDGGQAPPETYRLLALSHLMLGNAQKFEGVMFEGLKRWPFDAESHYHLGRYYYDQKAYRKALEAFQRVTALDADHHKGQYYAALCFMGSGQYESSENSFKTAIRIVEKNRIRYGWPFADLGRLLILKGEFESGIGWLYRGIRNHPDLPYTHFKYANALLQKEVTPEIETELLKAIELDPGYAEAYYALGRYYTRIDQKEKARQAFERFRELKENPQPSPYGIPRN